LACDKITPLVITYNEAPNIGRVLKGLTWAKRVIVLDSGSTDETLEICGGFANVEVVYRAFDDHTSQWNYGLELVTTEYCLTLDADYVVSAAGAEEMQGRVRRDPLEGYFARLEYCIRGTPLRSSILPPRLVLFRLGRGRYFQDGHTQKLALEGRSDFLKHPILHDDRKPLGRWLWAQERYATLEATKLLNTPRAELPWSDRIRRLVVVAPWLVPAVYLFARGGVRDGWKGLDYAAQRAIAELVLSLRLIEGREGEVERAS
jgi:glycosyltransferase involved in cell wall biosynthesis